MTNNTENYLVKADTDIALQIADIEAELSQAQLFPEYLDCDPFVLSKSSQRFLSYIINDADTLRNRLVTSDDAWHISQGIQILRGDIECIRYGEGADKYAIFDQALAILLSPGGDYNAVQRRVFGTSPKATASRLSHYATACASNRQEHFPGREFVCLDDIMRLTDPEYQPSAEFVEAGDLEYGTKRRASRVGEQALRTIPTQDRPSSEVPEWSFVHRPHQPGTDGLARFKPTDEQLAKWGYDPDQAPSLATDSYCGQIDTELCSAETKAAARLAKKMCQMCIVRDECLEDALKAGPDLYGVWGGLSRKERAKILSHRPTPKA